MALRAGYYGVKKGVLSAISGLSGAKIIKTIGDGLKLTAAGKLSCDIDSDTMEFKNGKLAAKNSGGGSGAGFIDTSTVIYSASDVVTSLEYTATADCCITLYLVAAGTGAQIYVNNVEITSVYVAQVAGAAFPFVINLKSGDTLSITSLNVEYPSRIKVFGLK